MLEREFHNGLRLLLNIDRYELEREGVIKANDHNAWGEFRRDPFRYFIRADDEKAARIWAIMERRMTRHGQQHSDSDRADGRART